MDEYLGLPKAIGKSIRAAIKFNPIAFGVAIGNFIRSINYNRNSSDTSDVTDQFYKDMVKLLTDTAIATDDLDGQATTLDDQEIQFHKVTRDTSRVTDQFSKVVEFNRPFTEAPAVGEVLENKLFKVFSDAVEVTDSTDVLRLTSEAYGDNGGANDSTLIVIGKALSDTAGFAEVFLVELTKIIQDQASVQDAKAITLASLKTDSSLVGDNALKSVYTGRLDSGIASDNGTYRGQSYSDFDYFLEDYVGYSGAF